jgi:hypothetical protein
VETWSDERMTQYNVSPAEYAQLQAKATYPVQEGWRNGTLTVFVPGVPYNFKSGGQTSRGGLMKHRRLVESWRNRTGSHLYAHRIPGLPHWSPAAPKRVTFTVYSRNPFDSDGREVACSPSRDALKDMQIIDDDRDSSRHVFLYDQVTSRKLAFVHGIAIAITLRPLNI